MGTTVYVPVEEYLSTSYRPDCDYVDGEVVDRNVGTQSHSLLQTLLSKWFDDRFDAYGCVGVMEQRVRVAHDRYRVPDVSALIEGAGEEVITTPPLVCIEVLSPDDTLAAMHEKTLDYIRMGVPNIWIFDPVKHLSWTVTRDGALHPFTGNTLPVDELNLALDLPQLFKALERRLHRIRKP